MFALLATAALAAEPVTYRGSVATQVRAFAAPPVEVTQFGGPSVSLAVDPQFDWRATDHRVAVTFEPFLRMDSHDRDRTHLDVRQAEFVVSEGPWSVAAGVGQFTWGVLTGARLVDVLNQLDLAEDLTGTRKLGAPFAQAGAAGGVASLQAWVLPYQRSRTFPGLTGRMRPPNGIDTTDPSYEDARGPWQPSFAARSTLSLSVLELGLSGFSGVSREPRLLAQLTDPRPALAYDQLQQGSLDAAVVAGPLLFKGEGALRLWTREWVPSWAVGGGVEATAYGVLGGRADWTFVAEYTHDVRPVGVPQVTWDHDVFVGSRIASSDLGRSELLLGTFVDVRTGFVSARASVQRRLDDHWRAGLEGTLFLGPSADVPEWWLLSEDHAQLTVSYFL